MKPDPKLDTPFESFLEQDAPEQPIPNPASEIEEFVKQLQETAEKLIKDGATRGDAKLLSNAMKELRHCFRVFASYRGIRKATIFGSARTPTTHPAFEAAVEFSRKIVASGWMVITGAASGIMEAGHVGAGRDQSFGLNILLPFEQSANSVITGDPKLMNLRYFFTRKLAFIKESDAVILFPGGFGTHDEAFETLTLIQTGKSHVFPIVMVDEPGGTYWSAWQEFIREQLLGRGYISPADLALYLVTDNVEEAVAEVQQFYKNYHSMRYVKNDLVLRLLKPLSPRKLQDLNLEFQDILTAGIIE